MNPRAAHGFPWLHQLSLAEVSEQEALAARCRSGNLNPGQRRRLNELNRRRPDQTVYVATAKTPQEVA